MPTSASLTAQASYRLSTEKCCGCGGRLCLDVVSAPSVKRIGVYCGKSRGLFCHDHCCYTLGFSSSVNLVSGSPLRKICTAGSIGDGSGRPLPSTSHGLSALVATEFDRNPADRCLYVFTNKGRDKIKLLIWHLNGYWLLYKRCQKQRFQWPDWFDGNTLVLTQAQLDYLLDGYNLNAMRPHKTLQFAHAI